MEHVFFNIGRNLRYVAENTKNLDELVELLTKNTFIDSKFDYNLIKLQHGTNLYEIAVAVYKSLLLNEHINEDEDTLLRCLNETGNEAISNVLKKKNDIQTKSTIRQVWFDIEPPSINFVGQEDHLENLEKWFLKDKTDKYVLIFGDSGMGKSELAKVFAKTFYLTSEGNCMWLSASNNLLQDSFQQLAKHFGQDLNEHFSDGEKLKIFVWEIFSTLSNRPCLLIIDDIINYEDKFLNLLIEKYILWNDHYLIITSRFIPINSYFKFKEIKLENLSNLDVKKYFSNIFNVPTVDIKPKCSDKSQENSQPVAEKKDDIRVEYTSKSVARYAANNSNLVDYISKEKLNEASQSQPTKGKMEEEIDESLEDIYKRKEQCGTIHRLIPDEDGKLIPLSMDNCYINLTVVRYTDMGDDLISPSEKKTPKDKEEYEDVRQSFNRPRSSEELNLEDSGKTIFQIEDIFEKGDFGTSKRIFLLGRAGIGKTTLCKKIVYDYYVNGLWKENFDRIIWLPLRIFKAKGVSDLKSPSLADIFSLQYFSTGDILENKEKGKKLVEENGRDEGRVLYLLDGLDEIQNLVGNGNSELSQLIECLCEKPFVIVTSRPYTYHNNFNNFDLILETIGFSTDNILDYIRVVFSNPSDFQKQKEIIEFIDKSPGNISGIATIPILLDIICFTWTDIKIMKEKKKLEITMTRLYAVLEKYLWGQFLLRTKKIELEHWRNTKKKKSEIYALVNKYVDVNHLPRIAYQMLGDNKIEFSTEEAMGEKEFGPEERILLKNAHFLHCLDPVEAEIQEMLKSYVFIHLTIQEYLAAVHIAKCLQENQQEFEEAIYHKYNPRYSIVWSFVSGILADSKYEFGRENDALIVETFFNYLERDPIDELGIAHQHLIVSCLNECTYPSILNEDRENRLMDELYSYIFAQYVADGKSLFEHQLPTKVLMKIIGPGDDDWNYGVSEMFQTKVLRQQALPDEIISNILDMIGSNDNSKGYEKLLRRQNNLNLVAVNKILEKISDIMAKKSPNISQLEKYLEILRTKRLLPSNNETLGTITNLIDYVSKRSKDIKAKVLDICLSLRDIPFAIIEQIVIKFSIGKRKRERGISDENWMEEILMGIITDEVSYPVNKMMSLVSQKCFLKTVADIIPKKLCSENSGALYRLIFLASRQKIKDGLQEKCLEFCINSNISYDVRRMSLYAIGNGKIISDNAASQLLGFLEGETIPIRLNTKDERKNLIYPSAPAHRVPEINFTYMASVIPLMKMEFYETYLKKREKIRFRPQVHLSQNQYDVVFSRILNKSFVSEICHAINRESMYKKRDIHEELLGNRNLLPATPLEWLNEFQSDAQRFLRNMAVIYETLFDNLDNETFFNFLREGRYFFIFFEHLLEEESEIDYQLYYAISAKYRPLIAFAHHLYNNKKPMIYNEQEDEDEIIIDYDTMEVEVQISESRDRKNDGESKKDEKFKTDPDSPENDEDEDWTSMRKSFESSCEQVLLEKLIVRALQNCEVSKSFISVLESELCEQLQPNGNSRLMMNMIRILEFKSLQQNTIGKIIDLMETGDEYEVETASLALSRLDIKDPADIEKLKEFLLSEENDVNADRKRTRRYVANIFEVNPRLRYDIQNDVLPQILIRGTNFDSKFKALKLLRSSQVKNVDILEEIPKIIADLKCGTFSHDKSKLLAICMDILLNQKKLPQSVLETMADYFDNLEIEYMKIYLGFLNLLRVPLPKKCIESLYSAIDFHFFRDIRELTFNISDSEKLMFQILKKQPLWNLLDSQCNFQFKIQRGSKRELENYKIKDKVIVEKIMQDKMPMAIQKIGGNLCCFCPNSSGEYPLLEFGSIDIGGILEKLLNRQDRNLKLPAPLDTITRFLKFHTPEENLAYIRKLQKWQMPNILDSEFFFIKSKITEDLNLQNRLEFVKESFTHEECRHLDLSGNNLTDGDILKDNFLDLFSQNGESKVKRLTTLILSDNKLTFVGLKTLLTQFQNFEVDNLFLDRNLISLSPDEIVVYINSNYRNDNNLAKDSVAETSKVKYLDLSINFISNGEFTIGDPWADKEIVRYDDRNDIKDFITNSKIIHSQDITDEKWSGEAKYDQMWSYCDSLCNPGLKKVKNINTEMGCIMIAEKQPEDFLGRWLFGRGHAFMVIECIPDPSYGQRQLILAHLEKGNQSRLQIEIIKISPGELKKRVLKCASSRTFLEPANNIIKKLIPRLYRSKKQVDIFNYSLLASRTDREEKGKYNCITWTDEMIKILGHNVDSMDKSKTRLKIIFVLLTAIMGFLIFVVVSNL